MAQASVNAGTVAAVGIGGLALFLLFRGTGGGDGSAGARGGGGGGGGQTSDSDGGGLDQPGTAGGIMPGEEAVLLDQLDPNLTPTEAFESVFGPGSAEGFDARDPAFFDAGKQLASVLLGRPAGFVTLDPSETFVHREGTTVFNDPLEGTVGQGVFLRQAETTVNARGEREGGADEGPGAITEATESFRDQFTPRNVGATAGFIAVAEPLFGFPITRNVVRGARAVRRAAPIAREAGGAVTRAGRVGARFLGPAALAAGVGTGAVQTTKGFVQGSPEQAAQGAGTVTETLSFGLVRAEPVPLQQGGFDFSAGVTTRTIRSLLDRLF